jgi:hypothetical protein
MLEEGQTACRVVVMVVGDRPVSGLSRVGGV